ncbi:MAG TPA: AAA family ATPase [Prolixibacteraceae bacterium]
MERTKRVKVNDDEHFIERKILIAMATNTDYLKQIRPVFDLKYIESPTAKRMASWCIAYFDEYGEAPNKQIEDIFWKDKVKTLSKDLAEEIELDILPSLVEEYQTKGVDQYLVNKTIKYFKGRQATILVDQLQAFVQAEDLDSFNSIRSDFKPLQTNISEDKKLNACDLYNMEIKPVNWLITDLLPKGLTIFGGKSKLGKSFFMLNLMINLAQGKWMFSDDSGTGFKGSRGAILYLSLEDPKDRFIKRMRDIEPEPNLEALKNLDVRFEWDKLYSGGLEAIKTWLEESKKEKKRPKLVVIDTIAKIWNKKVGTSGGNLYAEEYQIYSPLADLAHKYDIAIILITHTTKNQASDIFDEILGGAGTAASADNLMILRRTTENKRQLSIRSKDMNEKHLLFDVTEEGSNWFCLGEAGEVQKTTHQQAIYDFLKINGAMSVQEIIKAAKDKEIDVSPNSINTLLPKMVMNNKLEQKNGKYGKYSIAGTRTKGLDFGVSNKLNRK